MTVPATSANLGPGFDVIGLALGVHNQVEVRREASGVSVSVSGEGQGELPEDRTNLVLRAMEEAFRRGGPPGSPVSVHCVNSIPLAAGLGSSAAAIVAGLLAGRELCGWDADESELLQVATEMEGHGDNAAAALLGGLVLAVPYQGSVIARGFALGEGISATIFVPGYRVNTADARRVLPREVSRHDAVLTAGRTALLLTALAGGEYELLEAAMQDDLHQPFRAELVPGMSDMIEAARAAGAYGAALSGAGPSVIALHSPATGDAVADALTAAATAHGVTGRIIAAAAGVDGARLEPL
ncbi:MAG: homoserine kinase [Candidatus Dormibacteria bacterium]